MEFFKQSFLRIQQQLAGLTLSQRMLAVSLAAIMVVTVLFWGRYAASPEMVPVLDQTFNADQAARIQATLRGQGIRVVLASDGRIMVPTDARMAALASVAYNKQMPSSYAADLEKVASQATLWDSSTKSEQIRVEKREIVLGMIISKFPGVDEAIVKLDTAEKRSLTSTTEPTATVFIRMDGQARPPKQLVMAAASVVVGAQAGLSTHRVKVIVDGVSYPVNDEATSAVGASGDILENKLQWERYHVDKVRQVLANVPGALVGVSVDLELTATSSQEYVVDPKNKMQSETQAETTREESTMPTPPAPETGAVTNMGTAGVGASGTGGGTLKENEKTSMVNDWGRKVLKTQKSPGNGMVTAATVQIPRSYFVKMWKDLNPKVTTEPDEATLMAVITPEMDRVRTLVMGCTGLKSGESISVNTYHDVGMAAFGGGFGAEGGSGGGGLKVLNVVGGYGREVALGVLALAALMMVSGIVKKGAANVPAAQIAAITEQQRELERLVAGDEVVGSATEGISALEALELDEETSQTQQMIQQVTNMVKENPDAATTLVKRWMNRI